MLNAKQLSVNSGSCALTPYSRLLECPTLLNSSTPTAIEMNFVHDFSNRLCPYARHRVSLSFRRFTLACGDVFVRS